MFESQDLNPRPCVDNLIAYHQVKLITIREIHLKKLNACFKMSTSNNHNNISEIFILKLLIQTKKVYISV